MTAFRILRLLSGSALLIAGFCLPFAARTLSPDWDPRQTVIHNAFASHAPLLPDTRKPLFKAVPKGQEKNSASLTQFEETDLYMEFDSSLTITEIQNAIRAHFPGNHIPPGDPVSGHIRFEGWSGHAAVSMPFGWALAASLGSLLAGWLLIRANRAGARS